MASYWNDIIEPEMEEFDVSSLIKIRYKEVVGEMEIFIIEDFEKYGLNYDVRPQQVSQVTLSTDRTFIDVVCRDGEIVKVTEENDRGEVKVLHQVNVSDVQP